MTTPTTEPDATKTRWRVLGALRWAVAGAVCTSAAWLLSFAPFLSLFNQPQDISGTSTFIVSVCLAGLGAAYGAFVGTFLGLIHSERWASVSALSMVGFLFGAIGGGLSAPVAVALQEWLHPLLGSALAWALAGFVAGLIGHDWSRWIRSQDADEDCARAESKGSTDEETEKTAPKRVEWILRQERRRVRDWPLFRVLPVLVVSALLLVGAAALAPSNTALTLSAAGALGLAVALVLHAQETRWRHLDARLRMLERRFRATPDDTRTD